MATLRFDLAEFTANVPLESRAVLAASTVLILLFSRWFFQGPHFNKNGKAFLTQTLALGPVVVVPRSDFQWLFKQPKSTIVQPIELLHGELKQYMIPYAPDGEYVHPSLPQALRRLRHTLLWHRIAKAIDSTIGTIGTCKTMTIEDMVSQIVARAVVSIYLNEDLTDNNNFIHDFVRYNESFKYFPYPLCQYIPKILRPIFVPLLAAQIRHRERKALKTLLPLVKMQLDSPTEESAEPSDLLSLHIQAVAKSSNPMDRDPYTICGRFIMLSMGVTMPTMITTLTDVLQLLLARPDAIEVIRQEAATANKNWTARSISSMACSDSFLREVLRFKAYTGYGMTVIREVITPDGVRLPSMFKRSDPLPKGTRLVLPVDAIHRDGTIYQDANEFKPWRYVPKDQLEGGRPKIVVDSGSVEEADVKPRGNALPAVSDTFLAFGFGRDACPGRFFAADFMKLFLAHLLLHYDIRPAVQIPETSNFHKISAMEVRAITVET
ncbi:Major facilitator superfamily [Macrophomina phaseolina MS6]|uniref:Major facilitator superfamily n=1 Tax=Macrophomina phaseolina (strain MS6) TaxID=1126212 RepID=K2S0U7_MACPH|nr:Major facilitator superfamily [Macrophomina phaseolina MS6]